MVTTADIARFMVVTVTTVEVDTTAGTDILEATVIMVDMVITNALLDAKFIQRQ